MLPTLEHPSAEQRNEELKAACEKSDSRSQAARKLAERHESTSDRLRKVLPSSIRLLRSVKSHFLSALAADKGS